MAGGGGGGGTDDITRSMVTSKKTASFLVGALPVDSFRACFFYHLAREKIHCLSRVAAASNGMAAVHFLRHVTVSKRSYFVKNDS